MTGFDSTSAQANHYAIALLLLTSCLPTFAGFASFGAQPSHGLPTVAHALVGKRERRLVGLSRFELLTPRLSSVCSNQLSYRPSRTPAAKNRCSGSLKTR